MGRILVTPRSLTAAPHPAIETLRQYGHEVIYSTAGAQPSEAELLRLVPGTRRRSSASPGCAPAVE